MEKTESYNMDNLVEKEDKTKNEIEANQVPQYIVTVLAMLVVFSSGTVTGWTSPALPMLMMASNNSSSSPSPTEQTITNAITVTNVTNITNINIVEFDNLTSAGDLNLTEVAASTSNTRSGTITPEQASWVGSLVTVGALVGALPAGALADMFGRKQLLLALGGPLIMGWLIIFSTTQVYLLCLARFMMGLSMGGVSAISPVYVSEIAESKIRGALTSYYQLMFVGGILYVYVFGAFCSFRSLAFWCGIIPLAYVALFFKAPESPVYLLRKNKKKDAEQALIKLRGNRYNVYNELNGIQNELDRQAQEKVSFMENVGKRASIRALVICFGLMSVQQLSGINVVIFYADNIFIEAGSSLSPSVASIIVGLAQVGACYLCGILIEKAGRKLLLVVSTVVMSLCLAVLGYYFRLKLRGTDVSNIGIVPLAAVVGYILFFSIGVGPVPWSMAGELLPPEIKGPSIGLVTALNWTLAFVVTKSFQDLVNSLGIDVTFWLFTGVCALGAVFVHFIVIETKGKSLEQIQQELAKS